MAAVRVKNTFVEFEEDDIATLMPNKFRTCSYFDPDDVDEPTPVLLGSRGQATHDVVVPPAALSVGKQNVDAGKWSSNNTFIHTEDPHARPHRQRHRTCPTLATDVADDVESDSQQFSGRADQTAACKVRFVPKVEVDDTDSDPPAPLQNRRSLFRTEDLQEKLLEGSGYEPYLHSCFKSQTEAAGAGHLQGSLYALHYAPTSKKTSTHTASIRPTTSSIGGPSPTWPVLAGPSPTDDITVDEASERQRLEGHTDRTAACKVGTVPQVEVDDSGSGSPVQRHNRRSLFRTEDLQERLLEGSGYEPYLHSDLNSYTEPLREAAGPPQRSLYAMCYAPKTDPTSIDAASTSLATSSISGPHPTSPVCVGLTMIPRGSAIGANDAQRAYGMPASAPMPMHPVPQMLYDQSGGYSMVPPWAYVNAPPAPLAPPSIVPQVEVDGRGSDSPVQHLNRRSLFRTEALQERLLRGSGYEPSLHCGSNLRGRRNTEALREAAGPPQRSLYATHYAPTTQATSIDTAGTSPATSSSSGPNFASPAFVGLTMTSCSSAIRANDAQRAYGMPASVPVHMHPVPHMLHDQSGAYSMMPPSAYGNAPSAPPAPPSRVPRYDMPCRSPPPGPQPILASSVMHVSLRYPMKHDLVHALPELASSALSPKAVDPSHPMAPADCLAWGHEARAAAGGGRTRGGSKRLRLWAHIYLHMQVDGFDLVPRLIGCGGCNMRRIAEQTGAKLRIRGRGSGHLEVECGNGQKEEARAPLMIAVTTDICDAQAFRSAIAMTLQELRTVKAKYKVHCEKMNIVHEGPCYSIGLLPDSGKHILKDIIAGVPESAYPSRCQ